MKLLKSLVIIFSIICVPLITFSQEFTFIVMGDTGTGKEGQYTVSKAIENTCYNEKCEFVVLLGDNFYDEGVTSVDDPQFQEKLELPYANLDLPFYIVLGNHDYGKYANDWKRGDYQIQYAQLNPKWRIPSHYYSWDFLNARFVALDTSRLFWNKDVKKQERFVRSLLNENPQTWTISFAHHPYISNGEHGNAGSYDGVFISPFSGSVVKKFVEKELCKKVDLFMSGHDHNLQVLKPTDKCPHPFIVSGTGAKIDRKLDGKNPFYFQKAVLGFHLIKVSQNKMEVHTMNELSQVEHSLIITK